MVKAIFSGIGNHTLVVIIQKIDLFEKSMIVDSDAGKKAG